MQIKTLIALSILLLLIVLSIALSDPNGNRLADELVQRRRQQVTAEHEARVSASETNEVQLTRRLRATLEPTSGIWSVEDLGTSHSFDLPFKPKSLADDPADGSVELPTGLAEPNDQQTSTAPLLNESGYLGAKSCAQCHQDKYSTFIHTAHHLTSDWVTRENLQGSKVPPKNRLEIDGTGISLAIRESNGKVEQVVDFGDWKCEVPVDIVTGSGKTGRTFLFWHNNSLFQDYVSYLSLTDDWIPSPGFENRVTFSRPIRTGCLECHITYIQEQRPPNTYDRQSLILGISCERCHAPGLDHVEYHRSNTDDKEPKFITQPSKLSRQSQLELCGQCHSGNFKLIGKAFAYRPGDSLAEHRQSLSDGANSGTGGIHTSNQLTRLSMSKCFQASEMTCTSCHNPHRNERGDTKTFTARCVSCHTTTDCGMSDRLNESELTEGCIACHMPIGKNEGMQLEASAGNFAVEMIDHYIRIDRVATEHHLSK